MKAGRYHVLGRVGVTPLKEARDEARRRLALKYFPQTGLAAQEAIDLFLEDRKQSQRPKSHYLYSRALAASFPKKQLNKVMLQDLRAALKQLPPSNANLTHAIFQAFLNWCVREQHLTTNPLQGQLKPHKTGSPLLHVGSLRSSFPAIR
jgi:hypothetical protein